VLFAQAAASAGHDGHAAFEINAHGNILKIYSFNFTGTPCAPL